MGFLLLLLLQALSQERNTALREEITVLAPASLIQACLTEVMEALEKHYNHLLTSSMCQGM